MINRITIRNIEKRDNPFISSIIKDTLTEFGANRPGTVFTDPTTDHLFELFQREQSAYFIAEIDGNICGGAGIYPTEGLPDFTCEFVKMYLKPLARGIGLGKTLIEKSIGQARDNGYTKVYIESMPELQKALKVYEKFGFKYLNGPLGNSGHTGCSLWMLLDLERG